MSSLGERLTRRIAHMLRAGFQNSRILFYRAVSNGTHSAGHPRCLQPLLCHGQGKITFGKQVLIGYYPSPRFFDGLCFLDVRQSSARITIGDDVAINNGFTAIAEVGQITIGDRARIGPNVAIYESDFHGLKPDERNTPDAVKRGDVTIEQDVFIGAGVTILKGVTIKAGAVIAAGAVVTKSVESGMIAGGNPAKVLGPV